MASLDKTSVRTEVSRLKTDFEQLCADGKITAESKAPAQILKAPAINVDETSLWVDKLNHRLLMYSAGDITLKFLHRKRGKARRR